jgi:hypothetical protein
LKTTILIANSYWEAWLPDFLISLRPSAPSAVKHPFRLSQPHGTMRLELTTRLQL